jgi:hypothetical protein
MYVHSSKKSHSKQTDKRWSEEIYQITFVKDMSLNKSIEK